MHVCVCVFKYVHTASTFHNCLHVDPVCISLSIPLCLSLSAHMCVCLCLSLPFFFCLSTRACVRVFTYTHTTSKFHKTYVEPAVTCNDVQIFQCCTFSTLSNIQEFTLNDCSHCPVNYPSPLYFDSLVYYTPSSSFLQALLVRRHH